MMWKCLSDNSLEGLISNKRAINDNFPGYSRFRSFSRCLDPRVSILGRFDPSTSLNFSLHILLAQLSRRLEWAIVIAHRPSVRKLFTFSTSSPEPLDGFWWSLVGMKYSWFLTSAVVFRPAQGRIQGGAKIGHGVPFFKKLFLQTRRIQRQTKCIVII